MGVVQLLPSGHHDTVAGIKRLTVRLVAIVVPRQYQGVIFHKGSVEPEIEGALLVIFRNLVSGRE